MGAQSRNVYFGPASYCYSHLLQPLLKKKKNTSSSIKLENSACKRALPVQPGQQALGSADELHHRGQEVVGGFARGAAVVRGAGPALGDGLLEITGGCPHPDHQTFQVVRLHTVVLEAPDSPERVKANTIKGGIIPTHLSR